MKFGQEKMRCTISKISARELPYLDSVIVGDNSSGKTLMLKLFIEQVGRAEKVYFIDAVNRGFDVKKISRLEKKPEYKKTILDTRLEETFFNLVDSFNCYGTSTERVEMIYMSYESGVQKLFQEITGDSFKVLSGDPLGEVDFGEGKGLLSSGYQAMIRILLELLYFQDMMIEKQQAREAWVIIDELDEFLSPRYAAGILEFLKQKFSWARWLVTTHSCDLVAHTRDANLVILEDSCCEVMDINDYTSVSEVQIIFERLFGSSASAEPHLDKTLRRLLNNKINHAWSIEDEESLGQVEHQKLTASQQLIVNQIRKW